MATSAWGGSFGEAPNSAWGDSFGFEVSVVVPPAIPPGGGDIGHRGSLYWKRYQAELRRKKKRTKKEELLQELEEQLVELENRIEEAPPEEVEPAWKADLRRAQTFAYNELVTQQTAAEISVYVLLLREAIREMDDEEAIILALH
jgi:hypothetical protein